MSRCFPVLPGSGPNCGHRGHLTRQFGNHSGNAGLIFARLLRISRNSCGPLISLCLRSCRSSSVADGSPRRSISSPAISDALAGRSSMPLINALRVVHPLFWRVREIARADRQRSRCAPTRCSHWQTGGIRRPWTWCPPLAVQPGAQPVSQSPTSQGSPVGDAQVSASLTTIANV